MNRIAGCAVATIRVFEGGEATVANTVQETLGAAWPPRHGEWSGNDPCLLWRSPSERIALASSAERMADMLAALRPGAGEAGCALDLSEAIAVWRLEGDGLAQALARVADAAALPQPGHATRLRWADVAVVLVRVTETEALMLADATLEPYLQHWWVYACGALQHESIRTDVS